MSGHKSEAPGTNRGHNHSLAADGENNSTASIIHSNHCWNVTVRGKRIASFISESKAIRFAKAMAL